MRKVAWFLLFFLLLFFGCLSKVNESEDIEKRMAKNDEEKIEKGVVNTNYSNKTSNEQLVIYEAPDELKIEGIKEYKPFEIIEINETNA